MPSPTAASGTKPLISLVCPAYNEESGIRRFHTELLRPALDRLTEVDFEVLYVDDGSSDNTNERLLHIARDDASVRVIGLSRNFGKELATTAGINYSTGDAVIILDSDGQHPPDKLGEFIALWQAGAQVVVGVRQSNQNEGFVKKFGSKLFYRTLNSISDMQTVPRSTDYRLIDGQVRAQFLKLGERKRITRGLIDWLGFDRAYVEFDSPARLEGTGTYSVARLFGLAMNSFTSMSIRPLFAFGWVGLLITIIAFGLGVFVGIEQLILGDPLGLDITGSAMLGILTAFLVGLVLMAQGVMALYVSHIHAQSQERPLFVVNEASSANLLGPGEEPRRIETD